MKIKTVEELVGITKKNIRFYEEQGLLNPDRDSANGYRDYSQQDVEELKKIKLLRQLSVPIEEIAKLQKGYFTLEDCMKRHVIALEREVENVQQKAAVCELLINDVPRYKDMDTEKYLDLMEQKEKEGVRFVNVKKTDNGKKKAPIIAAVLMILFMVALIGFFIWGFVTEDMPAVFFIIMVVTPVLLIIGTVKALASRMKEINGGEEDEASKY